MPAAHAFLPPPASKIQVAQTISLEDSWEGDTVSLKEML